MTREEAISRQAVLEMAYDMSEIDGEHFTKPWMVVDVEDIQKLPSVKPQEPKTGHWIDHHLPEVGKCMQYMSECSVCGKMICNRYNIYKNFCPCCGAKMIEPQESETEQGLSYADQDTLMSAT